MIELSAERSEIAVLAAILLHETEALDSVPFLESCHFSNAHHQRYFEAMCELRKRQQPIDVVSLNYAIDQPWVMQLTNRLSGNACTKVAIEYHSRIIFDRYRRRQIVAAANQAIIWCRSMDNSDELVSSVGGLFTDAADGLPTQDIKPIADVMTAILQHVEKGEDSTRSVRTGIAALDNVTGGVARGLVTIVAARPSMGKSATIINIASNMSWSNNRVIIASLEDTDHFIGLRMIARVADMNYLKLTHGKATEIDASRLLDAAERICNGNIWIDDKPGRTLESLRLIALEHKKKYGLDCLVIDHLGEFTNESESYKSTSLNMRIVRDLAKELDIAVILACQLNRATTKREGNRPVLSDLRDSGRIEEVARNVWFLHRPAYYENEEGKSEDKVQDLELIIAKASHGKTGTVKLNVDFSRMSIW